MAYDPKQLNVLTHANGFTMWHYRTDDDPLALYTPGYFDVSADMLRAGDMIIVSVGIDLAQIVLTLTVRSVQNDSVRVVGRTQFCA